MYIITFNEKIEKINNNAIYYGKIEDSQPGFFGGNSFSGEDSLKNPNIKHITAVKIEKEISTVCINVFHKNTSNWVQVNEGSIDYSKENEVEGIVRVIKNFVENVYGENEVEINNL